MSAHEEKQYTIAQVALNLFFTCIISAIVIASVFTITKPLADKIAEEEKNKAMKEIVPMAQTFKEVEGKDDWFIAESGGKVVGYIVPSHIQGFGGKIEMIVGIAPDGKVLSYSVLKQNETPGLGDPIIKSPFKDQFTGKAANELVVTKIKGEPGIQALTGATISSKAATDGVIKAIDDAKVQFGIK